MGKSIKALIACLLSLVLVISGAVPAAAEETSALTQEAIVCADYAEAVTTLREKMVQRQGTVLVAFPAESADAQVMSDMLNEAIAHTGVPTQGDYLRWNLQKCVMDMDAQEQDGQYKLTLTYTFTYRTTAEQEARMDAAVEQLLDQLDVYTASDFEKISAIYDYICRNVTYDNWGVMIGDKLIYTAYSALIRKSAVCQGYATLLYRLATELGVEARLIPGTSKGKSHGWNIVRLGGKYYNVDATWDAELAQKDKPYAYFLRSDASFSGHVRKETYATEEFRRIYYMSDVDYSDSQKTLTGDLIGDGQVNEEDAIYLLQYVLMPDIFPVDQAVDYTADVRVDEEDAIYLLQYILMPDAFPL